MRLCRTFCAYWNFSFTDLRAITFSVSSLVDSAICTCVPWTHDVPVHCRNTLCWLFHQSTMNNNRSNGHLFCSSMDIRINTSQPGFQITDSFLNTNFAYLLLQFSQNLSSCRWDTKIQQKTCVQFEPKSYTEAARRPYIFAYFGFPCSKSNSFTNRRTASKVLPHRLYGSFAIFQV